MMVVTVIAPRTVRPDGARVQAGPEAGVPLREAADHLLTHTLLRGLHCPALRESRFMSLWDLEEPCKDPLLSPAPGFPHSSQVLETVERETRRQAEKTCQLSFPVGWAWRGAQDGSAPAPGTDSPVCTWAALPTAVSSALLLQVPSPQEGSEGDGDSD